MKIQFEKDELKQVIKEVVIDLVKEFLTNISIENIKEESKNQIKKRIGIDLDKLKIHLTDMINSND